MEINVPTRGEPPDYQQVGILTGEGNENIKPLYGRQTYRGSNQWNYFTSLDSHLATKIPVYIDGSDCTDERGCKEINKGDSINMGILIMFIKHLSMEQLLQDIFLINHFFFHLHYKLNSDFFHQFHY